MKNLLRILALIAVCAFAGTTFADDFKSVVIPATGFGPIRVHGDQFMFIRNFTQDITAPTRGVVMVTTPPGGTMVNVLSAAILDKTPLEVINSVVIAGPADVMATCDPGAICFISYKKEGGN
jgi:hypothetical protein